MISTYHYLSSLYLYLYTLYLYLHVIKHDDAAQHFRHRASSELRAPKKLFAWHLPIPFPLSQRLLLCQVFKLRRFMGVGPRADHVVCVQCQGVHPVAMALQLIPTAGPLVQLHLERL